MRLFALLFVVVAPWTARASPNVPPEDARYEELARRQAVGEVGLYQGGFGPLTEARVRALLRESAVPQGGWLRIGRVQLRTAFDRDRRRNYSTAVRPRQIVGAVAVTCEHQQGRPCVGSGIVGEVDGSVGYGDHVSGTVRLRANAGSQGYEPALAIDRAYVLGEIGPLAMEVGRDVLLVGPRSRTQLGWGDHVAPVDHARLSTARPLILGDSLAVNAAYVVGRLRAPQTFPGSIVTISRVQLDIVDRLEVGLMQILVLGGEGAAPIGGPLGFIAEHIRRADRSASSTDSSNRRFGGDVAVRVLGARLYYAVMFEDIRSKYWHHAVRYDADHLLGAELAALGADGRHAVVVELHTTGVRSQEHQPRVTGLTNAGRVAGAPLGPNATSLFFGGRIALPVATLYPWVELARADSDGYMFTDLGPIERVIDGPAEFRYRLGSRTRVPLTHGLYAEAEALVERVVSAGFEAGTARTNARFAISLLWQPDRWVPICAIGGISSN